MSTNNKSPPPLVVVSAKTMQQLLNEIDQVKINVEARIKTLEQIDTGHINADDNGDRLVEGRTEIKNLMEHIIDLQHQMDVMRKESDPNWPIQTFDEAKQNALKTLSNLSNQIEKAIGTIPIAIRPNTPSSVDSTVSTEDESVKGVGALITKLPFNNTRKTPSLSTSADDDTTSEEENEDIVADRKQEPQSSSQLMKKTETSSDESEDSEEEEDDKKGNHQLLNAVQSRQLVDDHLTDSNNSDSQSQTSTPPRINKNSSGIQVHSTPLTSPSSSNRFSRNKTPGSQQPTTIPIEKSSDESEDNSYSEKEEDNDDELEKLADSSEQEEVESVHNYDQTEGVIQELRMGTYLPGTQFRVTHNLKGLQPGDLTIHKDEILLLVEQIPDDWWLFKNPQTQEQGMVPINHIQPQSKTSEQGSRHRIKPVTSASTLVDVFKRNNYIPSGFIASDLAPLAQQNQYKLSHTLIPKRTESNFAFTDLHWRYDTDQIYIQQVKYQKILTIKKCLKIPKIKGQQIRVLNRCIHLCLYDGSEIISNIHPIRIRRPAKANKRDLTEDWDLITDDKKKYIDEQSHFLIRSNEYDRSKHLHLIIELSQLCQSKLTQETCEVGCGWIMVPLDDDNQSSIISRTKNYNEILHGGHLHETNILLNSQYKNFHSEGLSGRIDRYKQARIRFSLESRERHIDILYDNLPLTSMIVPRNLVRILAFYRNELAHQLQDSLSATPLDSIFLSTFNQTLEQPDLICLLQRLYHRRKELSIRQQREEFITIYELSIYPLLFYRLLPPYDFYDMSVIRERRKLIREIINKEKEKNKLDILAILLDPSLTDKWTPFTTDEICFSLQKYTHDYI